MTEEDEEALQPGEKFMVVGSVKETKEVTGEPRTTFPATRGVKQDTKALSAKPCRP